VAQSLDLALPTPCRIQWRKQLPNGAVLPDESKVMTGMLTPGRCAEDVDLALPLATKTATQCESVGAVPRNVF